MRRMTACKTNAVPTWGDKEADSVMSATVREYTGNRSM